MTGFSRLESFPKSARLLNSKDFFFRPYRKVDSELFRIVYRAHSGARLGMSISKKVLKKAVARNRIRRLIREAFRKNMNSFNGLDINLIAHSALRDRWNELKRQDLEMCFQSFLEAYNSRQSIRKCKK